MTGEERSKEEFKKIKQFKESTVYKTVRVVETDRNCPRRYNLVFFILFLVLELKSGAYVCILRNNTPTELHPPAQDHIV